MKQEILIQGLFRVGWRLIRAYEGLIQGLKDKPVSQPNLPTKIHPQNPQKKPNVPNPPILTQTFPEPPPQALPLRTLSHTLVLGSLAEDLTRPCSELNG